MVTIADVARHAGVAPSTVFYVLTGKRSISSETRTKVHDSVVELGYLLPGDVRPLWGGPSDVMALVLPPRDVHLPMVTRLVSSVAVAARGHGMDVLLLTPDGAAAGLRRAVNSVGVKGFLVLDAEGADERARELRELGRSSVLIGHPGGEKDLTCVDLDFEAAGARVVDHLADLGHHSIGFLGAPSLGYTSGTGSGFAKRTFAGFNAAAMRRGVVGTAVPVEVGQESVARTTIALLRSHPEITALVVHNEAALHQVIDCLAVRRLRVPQDIAVVAICLDDPVGPMSSPLTSVELSADDLGGAAVDLLAGLIGGAAPPPLTLVPPRLVRRESCSLPGPRLAVVGTGRSGGDEG